jgi:gamma-butyrobetaine dioxygenase
VDGGSSYFVDSFAAAKDLFHIDPEAFTSLRRIPVSFVYDNDGYHYYHRHSTIESRSESQVPGAPEPRITAINYSPPFQGPWSISQADRWKYSDTDAIPRSLRTFEKLLDREEGRYEFTMQEGDLVFFDNRRVLHARRSFKDKVGGQDTKEGEATRWLKGCYMDGDVVRNKMRVLTRSVMDGKIEMKEEWKEWAKRSGVVVDEARL